MILNWGILKSIQLSPCHTEGGAVLDVNGFILHKEKMHGAFSVEVLDHQDIKEFRLIQLDPAPQATPPISIMIPSCRKSFCGRLLCFTKNLAIMQFWFETVVGSVFYPWQGWVSVGGWVGQSFLRNGHNRTISPTGHASLASPGFLE